MAPNLISVMMPAYNAEQYIGEAIDSLLAQSYHHWELIIVNDGSSDRTGAIADEYNDSRINVFYQENKGEAAARNSALTHMQGKYLAFLDADDKFLPNHLEVTHDYLETHPNYNGVYTDGYYCDQDGNRLKKLSSRRRGPFEGYIFAEVVRGSDVLAPPVSVVLQMDMVKTHNLAFDTNIVIGPDWDFFTKYSEVAQFGNSNQITCLYRLHQSNISTRINLNQRALELGKCRLNAIQLENFNSCSIEIRYSVFYDLLVNLFRGYPEKQSTITEYPQFISLPPKIKARLFRLMASKGIIIGENPKYIREWLSRSRKHNPKDLQGAFLLELYKLNPALCQKFLFSKNKRQKDPLNTPPFEDLVQEYPGLHLN